MKNDYTGLTKEIQQKIQEFSASQKDLMQGFRSMSKAAMQSGILDAKTKELIALAVSVACRCKGCIGFHVKTLMHLKATRAEIEETLSVAVYMGGGPSLMYTAEALAAYEEFEEQ